MPLSPRREQGQVMVMFALSIVAILAMMALVFDVGNVLVQRRIAQNAADAGALAGVQMLQSPSSTPGTIYNTMMTFIEGNSGPWTTTTSTSSSCGAPMPDVCVTTLNWVAPDGTKTAIDKNAATFGPIRPVGIEVQVTRRVPSTFAQLVGIKTLTASGHAGASAGNGPADIMLAFDTTGSMAANQIDEQIAAANFVDMMNLTTDVNSVHIGMARFQGTHVTGTWVDSVGDGDPADYVWTPDGSAEISDASILSRLGNDPAPLKKLAANIGGGSCPPFPLAINKDGDTSMGPTTTYACGLHYVNYRSTAKTGTTMEVGGTRLPNAFDLMLGNAGNPGFNAWDAAWGGRPYSRNILIMMTDGFDWCQCATPTVTNRAWDDLARADAASLKLGKDGIAGTDDDVEIYTVGYFGAGESQIANGSIPYPCPGPNWVGTTPTPPPTTSNVQTAGGKTATDIDILLHDLSSSTAGTCDHYMPIKKSDDLQRVFANLAGLVRAGRLSQ